MRNSAARTGSGGSPGSNQVVRLHDCHPWRKKRLGGRGRLRDREAAVTVREVEAPGRESSWVTDIGMNMIILQVGQIGNLPCGFVDGQNELWHNPDHKGS